MLVTRAAKVLAAQGTRAAAKKSWKSAGVDQCDRLCANFYFNECRSLVQNFCGQVESSHDPWQRKPQKQGNPRLLLQNLLQQEHRRPALRPALRKVSFEIGGIKRDLRD